MDSPSLRETLTAAIRYWEPRRLLYNAALAAIVLANVAYCAAYIVDIFAQSSGLRDTWFKYRWVVFVIGLLFAGTITHFFALGLFGSGA